MAVTNADILGWLNANPNATPELINQTMAEAGVSAAQYQDATGTPPPLVQQATSLQQVVPPPPLAQTLLDTGENTGYGTSALDTLLPPQERVNGGPVQTNPAAPLSIADLYQQVLGRPPESAAVIADWQKQFGDTIDANEIAQFEKVAQLEKTNPAAATLKGQILGQNLTSQWTGQGYGSAEANAEAMAKLLADAGITDIKQFGKLESGGFGNKETGQEINRGSGRWENQGGENLFSGTGEGKGNTAFRVDMSTGTPLFYTTQGSSNDLFILLNSDPILNLGANVLAGVFGGPAGVAALNAAQGKDFKDVARATALSYLGQEVGNYYGANAPIDASNMTSAQFNDALESQLIGEMQRSGLTNAQITQFLENASPADIASITSALPVTNASDNLLVNAAKTPITTDSLINTLSQVPNIITTGTKAPEQVSPDVLSGVTSILSGGTATPPTVEVTAKNPNQSDNSATVPIITPPITTNLPTVTTPTVPTTTTTDTKKDTSLTASDVVKLISAGATIAGINAAVNGGSSSGGTQYPIIPIPENWATPPKPSVAPATALPPINFGDRNLLIGTQWEKFLDPNYGQVPEPVQYSQPSNLSYNDLMGILGSKQGMPSASSLSINDIISGIQNQYGQANRSAMG